METMDLRPFVYTTLADLRSVAEEWAHLLELAYEPTVFHTYEWVKANLESYENSGLHVLVFRDLESKCVAIIPLVIRRRRRYLSSRRWFEFAGLPFADYGGIVVRRGMEAEVAKRVVGHLNGIQGYWDGVCFEHVRQDDPVGMELCAAMARGRQRWNSLGWQEVRQLDSRAYMDDLAYGRSDSLEKARKKLSKKGIISFVVHSAASTIEDLLPLFFSMHAERFARKGIQSPLSDSRHQGFYRNLVRELAPKGHLWLSALNCGDLPIAMRFSLVYGRKLHLYATCFSQDFSKFSPSMQQLRLLLDYAFKNGIRIVDFGVGESPHKEQVGASRQVLFDVEICRQWPLRFESALYHGARRFSNRVPLVRSAGKWLRTFLPYQV